jgi:hypothetical protein
LASKLSPFLGRYLPTYGRKDGLVKTKNSSTNDESQVSQRSKQGYVPGLGFGCANADEAELFGLEGLIVVNAARRVTVAGAPSPPKAAATVPAQYRRI